MRRFYALAATVSHLAPLVVIVVVDVDVNSNRLHVLLNARRRRLSF